MFTFQEARKSAKKTKIILSPKSETSDFEVLNLHLNLFLSLRKKSQGIKVDTYTHFKYKISTYILSHLIDGSRGTCRVMTTTCVSLADGVKEV